MTVLITILVLEFTAPALGFQAFETKSACTAAGKALEVMVANIELTQRHVHWVCVPMGGK